MAQRGTLFVISGPAGAGKSEIVKKLLKVHTDIKMSVSCTTRSPRPHEVDGVDYHFKTDEEFTALVEQGAFYEWAKVHQNRYGTLKSVVDAELDKGQDMLLEIDVQGFANVKKLSPDAVGIFVSPPSRENLEARLRGRGTESEESLAVRLGNVAGEIEKAPTYDYMIVNRDWNEIPDFLDIAVDMVYSIVTAERIRTSRQTAFLDELTRDLKR